jgi:hypothetical protein
MMPGRCSSSRSRLGPDLGLMRLLCITFLAFCTARIFEPVYRLRSELSPMASTLHWHSRLRISSNGPNLH